MTHTAYLSLGSNVGSRAANLHRALELLKNESIVIDALSSIYETEPWGVPDQPMFLNMVARLKTTLNPKELLRVLLAVENKWAGSACCAGGQGLSIWIFSCMTTRLFMTGSWKSLTREWLKGLLCLFLCWK